MNEEEYQRRLKWIELDYKSHKDRVRMIREIWELRLERNYECD